MKLEKYLKIKSISVEDFIKLFGAYNVVDSISTRDKWHFEYRGTYYLLYGFKTITYNIYKGKDLNINFLSKEGYELTCVFDLLNIIEGASNENI